MKSEEKKINLEPKIASMTSEQQNTRAEELYAKSTLTNDEDVELKAILEHALGGE